MTIHQEESFTNFDLLLKRRNVVSLRLGALLISLMFPLFWILDWIVLPDHIQITLWLRLFGMIFSLGIWLATFRYSDLIYRYANQVGILLGVTIGGLISVIAWLDHGYESPYYAGLNLVILGASFLFSWPMRVSLGFCVLLYSFYMAPLLIGRINIQDMGVAITNHFFLLSTILVSVVVQQYRITQERQGYLDVQRQRRQLQEAEFLAVTDPLTGLYNRRQLFKLGAQELPRARRLNQPLSLLAVDIDHFKQINDTYGHQIGDELLREMAILLHASLRQGDLLARTGGDEFIVLLPDTNVHEAALIADRLCLAVQKNAIQTSQAALHITISIGAASLTESIVDLETLLLQSDGALYAAKRAGRAQVQIWSSDSPPFSLRQP